MNKMGSQCFGVVFLAVIALLVLASYMTFFCRVDAAQDATHVRVKITGKVTSETLQGAIDQVHRNVEDKGYVYLEFDDGELKRRAKHARDICSTLKSPNISTDKLSYYKHLNLLYCPVPKVATKFWFRALHILETGEKKSPFEINRGPEKPISHQGYGTDEEIRAIIQSAYKIMFTRDPYQRIFSAYVDKFLSPNPVFWSLGKGIIMKVRKSRPNLLGCGEDVTFREVIRYLTGIDVELHDFHFRPVSSQCDVCHIQYDIIGKVETFEHDAMFIFNQTHASERGMIVKNFKEESNIYNIIFNVHRAFSLKNQSLECISHHMVHRRLWRVLQISGLINKYDDYPLSPNESRKANETMIMNLVLRAYERSTPEARLNKQEALLQAYSQIPLVGLEHLRLKYLRDLMLFDYEERPSFLFDKGNTKLGKSQVSFDYFDVLTLKE
ncbi:carbohydrate sulfotransferase 10-like [Haliotis asinina]|uniref:carbohydrate sulfotransferase 10-like n=1 Tax=Haliotis asinina TaxID=109174 RepID=UPI003531B352